MKIKDPYGNEYQDIYGLDESVKKGLIDWADEAAELIDSPAWRDYRSPELRKGYKRALTHLKNALTVQTKWI